MIVALAIPLSLLFAFCGMLRFGIAASLLSLGAIDFGMVVDSSVVMVENCVRHLAHGSEGKSKLEIIRDAAVEVRKPTLFGELIIMIVYLPILTLEGVEGKLFRPMALTVIFALVGSMILSLTLMPVLASLLLPRKIEEREPLFMRLARIVYAPMLRFTLHHKVPVLLFAGLVLAVAFGLIAPRLGSEFVPQMSEGSIAIAITRLSGTNLEEAVKRNTLIERGLLLEFPDEIAHVWSRVGTAEVATDPMGVEQTDMYVTLKPRSKWRKELKSQAELTDRMRDYLRDVPGHRAGYRQPDQDALDEMISGVKGDLVVKLFGDDLDVLKTKADEIESVLKSIPGSTDVGYEQITGQAVMQVKLNPGSVSPLWCDAAGGAGLGAGHGRRAGRRGGAGSVSLSDRGAVAGTVAARHRGIEAVVGGDASGRANSAGTAGGNQSGGRSTVHHHARVVAALHQHLGEREGPRSGQFRR